MAIIVSLHDRRRAPLHAEQAAQLRQLLLPLEEAFGDTINEILYYIDQRTAVTRKWTFVMLSPAQNAAIVDYLVDQSERPMQAVRLWALCFKHLNNDTGEIMLRREEIAETLAIPPSTVTKIMSELRSRNAIISRRTAVRGMRGQGIVRYYMNPTVATHLAGKAREMAQEAAPPIAATPEPQILRLRPPPRPPAAAQPEQTDLKM